MKYQVKVSCTVVVEAPNAMQAKAKAESAVRHVVRVSYRDHPSGWADAWEGFTFEAKGAARKWEDGGED